VPLFLPIPFLALEIFVGFIQALVFAVLTAVFFRLAVEKAH
jgi:F-type H+-transporting ATPase subunit a